MTKRSIFEGYRQRHQIILNRFPLAPIDWAGAREMRDRHPVSPWTDDDLQDVLDWNRFCQAGEAALKNIEKLGHPATRVIVTVLQGAWLHLARKTSGGADRNACDSHVLGGLRGS